MKTLDLRELSGSNAAASMIDDYNSAEVGAGIQFQLRDYDASTRISLLEGGIRPRAMKQMEDKSYLLTVQRELCPVQGSITGLHHVLSDSHSVWTAERSTRVARIDTDTDDIVPTTSSMRRAPPIGYDHRHRRLLVADAGGDRVAAFDAENLQLIQDWNAPGHPQIPVANKDGVVCVTGSRDLKGTLTIAAPRDGRYTVRTVEVGAYPHDPLFYVAQKCVFVSCLGSNEIVKVRLADARVVSSYVVGEGPAHMVVNRSGQYLYCANSWDGSVTRVDLASNKIKTVPSGGWAHDLAMTPDGQLLYVANFLDDTISVFDANLNSLATLNTDSYPHGINMSVDGKYLVTTGFSSDHVRIFDAESHHETARVKVGMGGSHTAFAQRGDRALAYVACSVSDHLAVVDLVAGECIDHIRFDPLKRPQFTN